MHLGCTNLHHTADILQSFTAMETERLAWSNAFRL